MIICDSVQKVGSLHISKNSEIMKGAMRRDKMMKQGDKMTRQ